MSPSGAAPLLHTMENLRHIRRLNTGQQTNLWSNCKAKCVQHLFCHSAVSPARSLLDQLVITLRKMRMRTMMAVRHHRPPPVAAAETSYEWSAQSASAGALRFAPPPTPAPPPPSPTLPEHLYRNTRGTLLAAAISTPLLLNMLKDVSHHPGFCC